MKSDNIKRGIARTPHRGLLMATGVSKKNMKAPFIGIASSFSDLVPGHIGMRDLERQIEKGIHRLPCRMAASSSCARFSMAL